MQYNMKKMFNKNENKIKVYNKKVFYDTNGNYTIYWILWKTNENYELQISNKSYKILLENYTIQMKYKWKMHTIRIKRCFACHAFRWKTIRLKTISNLFLSNVYS